MPPSTRFSKHNIFFKSANRKPILMKSLRDLRTILSLLAALASVPLAASANSFTPGNLAILSADTATANNSTFSMVEINPATAGQSAVQTIAINGTSGSSALRMSGSAATCGGLSDSADGSLLVFSGSETSSGSANANTITSRGIGTLNSAGSFTLQATYTGVSGNQLRGAVTLNDTAWEACDQGGAYLGGSSAPSYSGNILRMKTFGSAVYVINAQGLAGVVSTWTVGGSSLTALSGIPTTKDSNAKDFFLVSSGQNGATYDLLYQIDESSATAGTILKYSLVSGTWTANGTYTTSFGGTSICAARSGNGAVLYCVTGDGTVAGNSVIKLTDTAGYNATITITTGNNVTLFTTTGTPMLKSIAFAPVAYTVTYNGNGSTGGSVPTDTTLYPAGATVTAAANTGSLARAGYTFAGWNTLASGTGTTYAAGSGTFAISASTTLYAIWTPNANYTVTYNGNNNTGGTAPTDPNSPYASGVTVTVLANTGSLVMPGYSFAGWNTAANGSGTSYAATGSATFVMGSANVILYAQWTQSPSLTVSTSSLSFPQVAVNSASANHQCPGRLPNFAVGWFGLWEFALLDTSWRDCEYHHHLRSIRSHHANQLLWRHRQYQFRCHRAGCDGERFRSQRSGSEHASRHGHQRCRRHFERHGDRSQQRGDHRPGFLLPDHARGQRLRHSG
jgi:uncharacterized repeat protein (TIGR02543 family)